MNDKINHQHLFAKISKHSIPEAHWFSRYSISGKSLANALGLLLLSSAYSRQIRLKASYVADLQGGMLRRQRSSQSVRRGTPGISRMGTSWKSCPGTRSKAHNLPQLWPEKWVRFYCKIVRIVDISYDNRIIWNRWWCFYRKNIWKT